MLKVTHFLTVIALFFLVAFTASAAMANDFVTEPHGTVIELDAGSTSDVIEQSTEVESSTSTTSSNDVNSDVIQQLRQLNQMARQSSQTGTGW